MISKIRDTLNTSAYRYIMWSFLIIFMISSLSLGLLFRDSGNEMMRINKYSVTKTEFSHKINTLNDRIKSLRQQFGNYADQFLQYMGLAGDPSQIAINELIREKLLLSAGDAMNITGLSNKYVIKKLENSTFALQHLGMLVPSYFYNSLGELNPKAVFNHLSRQNMSASHFETMVEEALRQFFVMSLIPTALYVSPISIDSMLKQEHAQKRTYIIFELRIDDYIKELKKTKTPEQELKTYFDSQNKSNKRYWTPEKRSGKAWKFSNVNYGIKDLAKEKFSARFMGDARRAITQNNEVALQEFIQKHGGKQLVLSNKTIDEESDKEQALTEKLFSIKAPGKSAAVFFEDHGYIVTLDAIQERLFSPFEVVSERVLQDFLKEKAVQKLELEANTLSQNNTPQGLEQFSNNTTVKSRIITINNSSKDSKDWAEAEKNGLPVARMQKMIHPGYALVYDIQSGDGIGVIILDAIDGAYLENEKNVAALTQKAYAQELSIATAAFIDSLQKSATIINKDMPRV